MLVPDWVGALTCLKCAFQTVTLRAYECQSRTLLCTNPISYKADNVGQKVRPCKAIVGVIWHGQQINPALLIWIFGHSNVLWRNSCWICTIWRLNHILPQWMSEKNIIMHQPNFLQSRQRWTKSKRWPEWEANHVRVCCSCRTGFSGNTISFVTLPVQNCVIIYEHLYIHMSYVWHSVCRHMVLTYRLGIKSEWTMGLNESSCWTCINLAAKWNCTHKLPYALCCIV